MVITRLLGSNFKIKLSRLSLAVVNLGGFLQKTCHFRVNGIIIILHYDGVVVFRHLHLDILYSLVIILFRNTHLTFICASLFPKNLPLIFLFQPRLAKAYEWRLVCKPLILSHLLSFSSVTENLFKHDDRVMILQSLLLREVSSWK